MMGAFASTADVSAGCLRKYQCLVLLLGFLREVGTAWRLCKRVCLAAATAVVESKAFECGATPPPVR